MAPAQAQQRAHSREIIPEGTEQNLICSLLLPTQAQRDILPYTWCQGCIFHPFLARFVWPPFLPGGK